VLMLCHVMSCHVMSCHVMGHIFLLLNVIQPEFLLLTVIYEMTVKCFNAFSDTK